MSIIANGGGVPPSREHLDRYEKARLAEIERKKAHIAAMRERGYNFQFRWNAPDIIWCLTCGLMVGDVDVHDTSPCKTVLTKNLEAFTKEMETTNNVG